MFQNFQTSHNPYFNRWFSAITPKSNHIHKNQSHNPYFNRWFSAMEEQYLLSQDAQRSQSLF